MMRTMTIKGIIAKYLVEHNITPQSHISKVILDKMWGDGIIPKEGLYINRNKVNDVITRHHPPEVSEDITKDDESDRDEHKVLLEGREELKRKQEALREKIENIRKSIRKR